MIHPIIIIEGPDGTGKTTWADRFCEMFKGRKIHLTLRKSMLEYQVGALDLALRWSQECPVVIDRHWPSEQIYAGVYRGGSKLQNEAKFMSRVCDSIGVFYVVAIMSSPELMVNAHRETHATGREMYEPDDRFRQVANGYYDWWHGTGLARHLPIGFCHPENGGAMNERRMKAFKYDRNEDGQHLSVHCDQVKRLASVWRKHRIEMSPVAYRNLRNRHILARECGMKIPLNVKSRPIYA